MPDVVTAGCVAALPPRPSGTVGAAIKSMKNDAPNPPSAAEPQPKGAGAPRVPTLEPTQRDNHGEAKSPHGEARSPRVAPEPAVTPVNPDQADG